MVKFCNYNEKILAKSNAAWRHQVSLFWRALLALQQRQIWQARTDLTAAIQAASRPAHSRIYFWDGIAKWLGEEKDEAMKSWQESYRLSVVEKKVSRHTEPARIWLLGPTIGDLVVSAK